MGRIATLKMPGLYPHQQRASDAPQPFKLLRWGRRTGKTVQIFRDAVLGHGPIQPNGEPLHRGMRHGLDVVWVGRSKDQARTIWNNEVKPRFEATGIANINETLLTASLPGMGRLIVKSQDRDSINNVRGMGSTIAGFVGDEVAHWDDAEGVWLDVLLPILTDNLGWATFVSTTEPGSWFNRQCAKAMAGELDPAVWLHCHHTARDNPRISPVAFERMIAEYPEGDPRLAKEVYAELTVGGAGHALVIREAEVLLPAPLPPFRDPSVTYFGAVDWGYAHPFSFGLYAVHTDGVVVRVDGVQAQRKDPPEIAVLVAQLLGRYGLTFQDLQYTVGGGDIWQDKGRSLGMKGLTIGEQWRKMGWGVRKGDTRRVAGLSNIRTYLHEKLFRIAPTQNGLWFLRQLQDRVLDERHPEDARKDDARADGTGGDDGYDECLPGETVLVTREGPAPIAALVGTSGEVWTPVGWRAYSAVRQTQRRAETVRIALAGGQQLAGTPNHPILTPDGWVPLGLLMPGDRVIILLPHVGPSKIHRTEAVHGRDSVWGAGVSEESARLLAVWPQISSPGDLGAPAWTNPGRVARASQESGQVGQPDRESVAVVAGGARRGASRGVVGGHEGEATPTRGEDTGRSGRLSPLVARARADVRDQDGGVVASDPEGAFVPSVRWNVPEQDGWGHQVLLESLQATGGQGPSVEDGGDGVRGVPHPDAAQAAQGWRGDVLPLVPWSVGTVESTQSGPAVPVYNLEVADANCYTTGSGIVAHNCKIALLSRPRIPSTPTVETPDEPWRELPVARRVKPPTEIVWNPDGTPAYGDVDEWVEA